MHTLSSTNVYTVANTQTAPECFVIMPFSDGSNYPKDHFQHIYEDIFVPAIVSAGFHPVRCDEIINSKTIPENMFDHLDNAPVVLCDLSSFNPNVMYELGRRHFQQKPTLLVQECGQEYIFDLQAQGFQIHTYRKEGYYRTVLEDREKIKSALLSMTEPEYKKSEYTSYTKGIEFHSLRTEYYKDWPYKKTRSEIQIEPPNESALASNAYNRLMHIMTQSSSIRLQISSRRDPETLAYIRSVLSELQEALLHYHSFCQDYDEYREASRLERRLLSYIKSFNE